jgi:rare lipoprotein A
MRMGRTRRTAALLAALVVAGCAGPRVQTGAALGRCSEIGLASWYRPEKYHSLTASGERYRADALTAAHRFLPFGTRLLVTDLATGRAVIVRINDRGPYTGGRIIDLSAKAAQQIGMIQNGVVRVRLDLYSANAAGPSRCLFHAG